MRGLKASLLALGSLSLMSCDSIDVPFIGKEVILPCPDYFILEDAATLTEFVDGPGRDITDVLVKAQIGEMQLACLSDIEPETGVGNMVIEISPFIASEMGPANRSATASLPYFVVVTDPLKNILYREALTLDVSFRGNKTQVIQLAPPTSVEIPITPKTKNNYYRIYSGFELTKDQVEYNRKAIQDRLQ